MALTDEKEKQKIQCDNCTDENSAAKRCEECAVFLCSYCSEFHKKSRSTKHHVLTTLQELTSSASPSSVAEKIRCKKHKEELIKLYCKTCQATICRDCTIVEHRNHDYGFIEDVAAVQKEVLQQNMNEVKIRQATLQRGIASLSVFDQSLVQENALVVAQVTSHFEELQRMFVSKKNELLLTARSLTISKRKQIQAQIEALEVALASCKSSIDFTEKALKNGNDVQVLSMQKYILQSLQDLKKVKDVTQPCVRRDLTFSIPWSTEDTNKNFLSNFSIQESVGDPNQCQAEFTDQSKYLKRNNETSVKIICFDKHKKRVKHGGQGVQASISGIAFDNATIQDHTDGTYTVTFTPRGCGTMEFKATVDGHSAPGCSLTKDVAWMFSSDYGNGELIDGGLGVRSDYSGSKAWRIGECSFSNGVHSWKILINHLQNPDPNNYNYGYGYSYRRRNTRNCQIGVSSAADHLRKVNGYTFQIPSGCNKGTVTATLNIPTKKLHLKFEGDPGLAMPERVQEIDGDHFWPFISLWGDVIEATLKYDCDGCEY